MEEGETSDVDKGTEAKDREKKGQSETQTEDRNRWRIFREQGKEAIWVKGKEGQMQSVSRRHSETGTERNRDRERERPQCTMGETSDTTLQYNTKNYLSVR